jgi:hypothetical protein
MIRAGDILSTKTTRVNGFPAGTRFVALRDEHDGIVPVNGGDFLTTNFEVVKKSFAERIMYLIMGD